MMYVGCLIVALRTYCQIQLHSQSRYQQLYNLGAATYVNMTASNGGFAALTKLRNISDEGSSRFMTVTTNYSRTPYYHCGFYEERRILVQVICRHFGYRMGISKAVNNDYILPTDKKIIETFLAN